MAEQAHPATTAERRQLLVDISVLARQDDKSGIQRVVRSVLHALRQTPPPGYRIATVYDAGGYYAYADGLAMAGAGAELPIAVRPGDIFYGLDLSPLGVCANAATLADLRRHGVRLYFMIYDLLPITRPQLFMAGAPVPYTAWLRTIAQLSDGLICISRAVADDVLAWLEQAAVRRSAPLEVSYCHLGADLLTAPASTGIDAGDQQVLSAITGRPTLLMVGTLEPRKSQAQALDAFELLWRRGVDASLVIVGRAGWMVEALTERLRQHAELGRRLFWLDHASDEMLLRLYQTCSALLAASQAEGFGLPLIEAAQHGLPVVARDIPVFREVGGQHAFYFNADDDAGLAEALIAWLDLHASGRAPASAAMPHLHWAASTAQIVDCLLQRRRYRNGATLMA